MRGSLPYIDSFPSLFLSSATQVLQNLLQKPIYAILGQRGALLLHHPTVSNYFKVDLVMLKAMSQELADLFSLTLPVSWKK
ncbi:MAG: hypothetical protein NVSMB38_38820 [Ktedonobacteraceae bacterium]